MIYVLHDAASKCYKIGFSPRSPARRRAALQTAHANRLHLVYSLSGTTEVYLRDKAGELVKPLARKRG